MIPCSQDLAHNSAPQRIDIGTPRVFENIGPFTIGKLHFLIVTWAGQERRCTKSIRILSGSTAVPQLLDVALTEAPPPLCAPGPQTYRIADPPPVTEFYYTVDGDTVARTHTTTLQWGTPGTYELCVGADNLCSEPVERCYPVTVSEPTPVDTTALLCPGDCHTLGDSTVVCQPGSYAVTELRGGCPVPVTTTLVALRPDTTRLLARVCSGDTLHYLGQRYATTATHEFAHTNAAGCDSTVLLDVVITTCPLRATIAGNDASCADRADASLSFTVASGDPPFRYTYRRLGGGGPAGSGTVAGRDQPTRITGLPGGTYLVEITDEFGSAGYLNAELRRPDPLLVDLDRTAYGGGFPIDCAGAASGALTARARGGVAPYAYAWNGAPPAPTARLAGLAAGDYAVRVTDANGCRAVATARLDEPPPLTLDYLPFDEACGRPGSGSIDGLTPGGGVAPYTTTLRRNDTTLTDYDYLPAGRYALALQDANGCTRHDTVVLRRPTVPGVTLAASPENLVFLGDSLTLTATTTGATAWAWELPTAPACPGCPRQRLLPPDDFTARLRATSADGCVATDSLRITVAPRYAVFVPNAFSPNGDGVNDRLLPELGPAAVALLEWRVYDRWGGLRFAHGGAPAPLPPEAGWDGTDGGAPLRPGVYVWTARVRFLDGRELSLGGDVALLR